MSARASRCQWRQVLLRARKAGLSARSAGGKLGRADLQPRSFAASVTACRSSGERACRGESGSGRLHASAHNRSHRRVDRDAGASNDVSNRARHLGENTTRRRYRREHVAERVCGGGRPSCGAPSRGRPRSPLPGGGGSVDRADRGASRPLAGDDQGLLLRSHREKGRSVELATKVCAAAAARRRRCATARATRVSAVRPVIRAPSEALDAPERARRDARVVQRGTGGRRPMTGLAHTHRPRSSD